MQPQAIPPIVMAGIAFYVASYHLLVYFRRKDHREYLTFGLSCLAVGFYDVLCAGLYSASSVIEGARWQHAQFAALALVAIPFVWFVAGHTGHGGRRMLYALSTCYAILAIIQLVDRSDLTLVADAPSIKRIRLPAGLDVTYYEARPGVVTDVQTLLGLLVIVYMLRLAVLAHRSGRRKQALPLLVALGLFAGTVLNDTFVSTGVYPSLYLIEYGYMAMIILMAYSLSGTVVEAATAKEALRATEERFRSLVETSGDWVWETDRRGVYTYASPTVRALLGYEPEDVVGRTPFDLMPPDEARRVAALFQEIAAAARPPERLETAAQRRDGRLVVLDTNGAPFFDADGALLGYRGITRDITERKQAEMALQESEAKFRSLVENAPTGILIVTDAYQFTYVNDELCRILGHSRAELIGQDFRDFLDEESRSLVADRYVRRRRGEEVPARYEFNIVRKNGERRRTEIRSAVIGDSRGQLQTIAQLLDVTEQRRAEDALREKTAELDRYFTSALDLLCIADTDAYFRRLNKEWESTLGYPIQELEGKHFLEYVHPDDKEATQAAISRLGEQHEVLNFVNRYRSKDGSYRWVEWRSSPVGKMIYAAARDITKRKQVEADRERLIAELEQRNAELERFTYTVSHDLRSPLVTITGFLGYLRRDALAGDVEKVGTDIDRIVQAVERMQLLLEELLELSRIGRVMNPPQAVAFAAIVGDACRLVQGRIDSRGVQVEVASDLPVVYGDRVRLVEVVQNLVDNACKFMGAQAEPRITIGQRGSDQDGQPILFVRDNGIGIDVKYQDRIFGLFDKLEPGSEGTGIGLALVKRIVEVHGGRVWVESERGRGSTFCFTIQSPGESGNAAPAAQSG